VADGETSQMTVQIVRCFTNQELIALIAVALASGFGVGFVLGRNW